MKKTFVAFALLVAALTQATPLQAQRADSRLQRTGAGGIVNMNLPQAATAAPQEETYGQHILRLMQQSGRPLPMPEEKILRLKPGTKRLGARQAEGTEDISFSGMLQYNMLPNGMMALEYGFYRFSSKNGFVRETMADVDYCLNGRGAYYNHKLHGTASIPLPYYGTDGWYYAEWDADTWQPTGLHGTKAGNELITKAADWDPTTGICYATKEETSGSYVFMKVDYEHMAREIIGSTSDLVVAMAINSQGEMYGVTEFGGFVKIDKTNGKLTKIGQLDFDFYDVMASMTFDRQTDRLYLCATEVDEDEEEMYGRLCEIDVNTGRTILLGYLPEAEEYTCLQVLYDDDDEAPAPLDMFFVNFPSESGVLNGIVGFTVPTTTIGGDACTQPVHYVVTVNDDDDNPIEGDAQPGDYVAKVITAPGQGRVKVVAQLSTTDDLGSVHTGQRNVAQVWLGTDVPAATGVNFAYDEASGQATVSWTGTVGKNGGRVNDAELTYDVFRYPGAKKVAAQMSGTSTFTEKLENVPYDGYYYLVQPYRGEEMGVAGASNVLQFGQALEVPYSESFDSVAIANRFTMIDGNGDGVNWTVEPFTGNVLYHTYSKVSQSDDWALTPPIHLVAGVAYQVSFTARAVSPQWPEVFSLACGQGTDPATYVEVIPQTTVSNAISQPKEFNGEIKIQQSGDYRFGFHHTSPALRNALFIDDLQVTAGQLLITPDSVKNLALHAADEGDLEVTIDFDAPTLANDGTELAELTRIEIRRGEKQTLVTTIAAPTPGQHYSYVDEDAVNGLVPYSVTAFNEAGAGLTATQSVYVGIDAPNYPTDPALADNLDGTATLSWKAPLKGQHNGYVDPDEFTYNIYTVANNQLEKVADGFEGNAYTVTGVPQTGDQGQLIYGVSAVNDLGESPVVGAAPLIYGAPYAMPFMEGFLSSGLKGIWSTRSNDSNTSFKLYSGMSADGDDHLTAVESETAGVWASLTSGKISMAGATSPKLVFAAYGDPGSRNMLKVAVAKNGEAKADTLLTVDYSKAVVEDFMGYSIDLSAYKSAQYITVTFVAFLNDPQIRLVAIDDVNVRNVYGNDLTAYVALPSRTTQGQTVKGTVTIHNVGEQTAQGYEVNVVVNGTVVQTIDATSRAEAVRPFERHDFAFTYQTRATDPQQSQVWATVTYPADEFDENNTSDVQSLLVVPTQLEAVSGLVATPAEGVAQLAWQPVSGQHSVTESFEGYETFSTSFGEWVCVDQDKCATAAINGLYWPGQNQPMAFMTFNFREAGVTEALMAQYPQFEANSGTQFAACFKANDAPGNRNNDWLISPQLSGQQQTIQLYAESVLGTYEETFEVRYSTTGSSVTDFPEANIIDTYTAPKNYFGRFRATLPAGAKYFAIHCNSQYGGVFMVDDISYEGKALTLQGYNVYCDGQLVGTTEAGATTFEHNTGTLATGQHTYHVTALYDEGESPLSNQAMIAIINGISSTGTTAGVSVNGGVGCIEVTGAQGLNVAVYTLSGAQLMKGVAASNHIAVPAQRGQYVVVVDGVATNLIVK